jgi:hypothetical protein
VPKDRVFIGRLNRTKHCPDREIMVRKLVATALLAATMLIVSGAAEAAAPGPTGDIDLAPTAAAIRYGGSVSFVTSVQGKIASNSRVYVTVVCLQGPVAVYQYSAAADFVFPLVDQAGLEWNGGSASCTGTLIYRVYRPNRIEIHQLDQVPFEVAGSTA